MITFLLIAIYAACFVGAVYTGSLWILFLWSIPLIIGLAVGAVIVIPWAVSEYLFERSVKRAYKNKK